MKPGQARDVTTTSAAASEAAAEDPLMLEDVSEACSRRRPERWFSRYRRMKPGQARDVTTTSAAVEDVSEAHSRRRPGRWFSGFLLVVLIAQFVNFLITNENLRWDVVADYMFDKRVLDGVATTLQIWALVVVLSTALGTVVCLFKVSSFWLARSVATTYVAVFLAIPGLVQLLFWFNIAFLLPEISIGIPFGPLFASWDTNVVVTPWAAAIFGLTIVESAYIAEIIRGGLLSVPRGQYDAAQSVGFNERTTFFRVILPQALRAILPPWGTKLVTIVKATSLVSIIGQVDLLGAVRRIYNVNYLTVPLLLVAIAWYLILVTGLTFLRDALERRFSRGYEAVSASSGKKWRRAKAAPLAHLAEGSGM